MNLVLAEISVEPITAILLIPAGAAVLLAVLPGYWLVNLHTSYKVTKEIEVFGLVQNLFDRRYYTFGTFFETDEVPFLNLKDPRTLGPGAPRAAYAGVRAKF